MSEISYTWENVQLSESIIDFLEICKLQHQIYKETVAMNSVNVWYEFECN